MVRAGVDPKGAVEVQKMFTGQEALSVSRQDPYMLSHPMSRDRLRAMQGFVTAYGKDLPDNNAAIYWFARAQAKLSAFKRAPAWTLRRTKNSATKDIGLMSQAAAYHRQSDLKRALSSIDGALSLRPNDPFYMDLKGQILLESRQANAAVNTYAQASKLAPQNALILGGLGRALLAADRPREALSALEKARDRDWRDARVLRDLSVGYAKTGQTGMASVVTAERYALQGRMKDAALHAKRAEALLPRGSGPWQRAQDVLLTAERALKR
jgi:predicted Zn-dependent protease